MRADQEATIDLMRENAAPRLSLASTLALARVKFGNLDPDLMQTLFLTRQKSCSPLNTNNPGPGSENMTKDELER